MKTMKLKNLINTKWKLVLSICFCVFFINMVIFLISGQNIIENGLKSLLNSLTYNEEVKKVEIVSTSHSYENRVGGSWNLEQNVEWVDSNIVELNFSLNTVGKISRTPKDYILVLDTSGSMAGERLDTYKENISLLVDELFTNKSNKVGLISYNSTSNVLSNLTTDINAIKNKIDTIEAKGDTNYAAALKDVGNVLKNGNYKSSNDRDLIVLFFTDGYPNIDSPSQISEYQYLKSEYSNLNIIGIQYDMDIGGTLPEVKEISDIQVRVSSDNLVNRLLGVFNAYLNYDNYKIEYYINDKYFNLVDINNIEYSDGTVIYGQNKITWDFKNTLVTGTKKLNLKLKLKLKDNYENTSGYFNISNKIVINYKVNGEEKYNTLTREETPVLKRPYTVTYDTNNPYEKSVSGCNIKDELVENHKPFSIVTMKDTELICKGYQFVGWEIADESTTNLVKLNDEKFIMPSSDVIIRAVWSKVGLEKTMGGTIHEKHTLFDQIAVEAQNQNGITTLEGTETNENPIYYYTSDVKGGYKGNNNVVFANFCWKIIRTTDTSGIKLIYNGLPDSTGTCPSYGNGNGGRDAQLETTTGFYKSASNTLADMGYMSNSQYPRKTKQMSTSKTLISTLSSMSKTDYYYANKISYNETTKRYTLVNPTKYGLWSDHYTEVSSKGRYTCRSNILDTSGNISCNSIYYIFGGTSTNTKYVSVTGGNDIDDYTLTLSANYTGSNPYNLTNSININYVDWYENYKDYNNYYMCSDFKTTNNCTNLYYVINTTNNSVTYVNMENRIKYGNSVKYENGNYILTEDNASFKTFWDWEANYKTLNDNHYTCFNETGVCSEVYYLNFITKTNVLYLTFSNGEKVEDALELSLGADDTSEDLYNTNKKESPNYINKKNSSVKQTVDNWFKDNLLVYQNYLEDTVFCNERGISELNSWNPNGGNLILSNNYLIFTTDDNENLSCARKIDSFSVSDSIGNGDLTYPVGLITYREAILAGESNIRTGSSFWTMSPSYFENDDFNFRGQMWYVFGNGGMDRTSLMNNYGVRPVISLRPGVEYSRGDGTNKNPYIVDIA